MYAVLKAAPSAILKDVASAVLQAAPSAVLKNFPLAAVQTVPAATFKGVAPAVLMVASPTAPKATPSGVLNSSSPTAVKAFPPAVLKAIPLAALKDVSCTILMAAPYAVLKHTLTDAMKAAPSFVLKAIPFTDLVNDLSIVLMAAPFPSTGTIKQEPRHIKCSSLGRATNGSAHQPGSTAAHPSNNGIADTSQHLSARQDSSFWAPISQYPTEPAASSWTVHLVYPLSNFWTPISQSFTEPAASSWTLHHVYSLSNAIRKIVISLKPSLSNHNTCLHQCAEQQQSEDQHWPTRQDNGIYIRPLLRPCKQMAGQGPEPLGAHVTSLAIH